VKLGEAVAKAQAELGETADSLKLLERAREIAANAAADVFCVSEDGETFEGEWPTREEATAAAADEFNLLPGATLFTGRSVPAGNFTPQAIILIEQAQSDAYDRVGLAADDWFDDCDLRGEAMRDLQTRIDAVWAGWLKRYDLLPRFHAVDQVEQHQVQALATGKALLVCEKCKTAHVVSAGEALEAAGAPCWCGGAFEVHRESVP
jgi:hypothetical protein